MKIFKVIAVLLTLSMVSLIIESCTGGKCPRRQTGKYTLSSFSIFPLSGETVERTISALELESMGNNPYTFRKDFGVDIVFHSAESMMAKYKPSKSLFMQSAYALTCLRPLYYPIDSIISIQIFSDKNFGETHLAGIDIAEFFKTPAWNGKLSRFISLEEYLLRPAPLVEDLEDFYLRCLIIATDAESGEHSFRIVVKLSDERTLEQSIKKIFQ